ATSGTPEPALSAFCSLVYSVVEVPALTRLTVTFGYFFMNAAAMSLSCGAHAQTVSVDFFCSAAAMSFAPAVLVEPAPPEFELLEHADNPAAARTPAARTAAPRRQACAERDIAVMTFLPLLCEGGGAVRVVRS